jgi:hypothetical protein
MPKKPRAKVRAVSMTRCESLAQKVVGRWDERAAERRCL